MGMSISSGSRRGQVTPQMNVTPLVDVVLVLLIIFMVVTPLLSKQLWLEIPKQEESKSQEENRSVVLSVEKDGAIKLNGTVVPEMELRDKLARMMAARPDKVVYFDAADDAPYATTVQAMDLAKLGGAKTVAILAKKLAP